MARTSPGMGIHSNPAALGYVANPAISLSHRKLFNLHELQQNQLSFHFRALGLGASVGIFDFGSKLYRENVIAIGTGEEIIPSLSGGLGMTYYNLSVEGGGSDRVLGFNLGCLWKISESLSWGWGINNFNRPAIGSCRENLPVTVRTGLDYRPIKDFEVCVDLFKDDRYPLETRAGVEYSGLRKVVFRVGGMNRPVSFSSGFDIVTQYIIVSYAVYTHNQLGLTHTFGLLFNFGRTAGEQN